MIFAKASVRCDYFSKKRAPSQKAQLFPFWKVVVSILELTTGELGQRADFPIYAHIVA